MKNIYTRDIPKFLIILLILYGFLSVNLIILIFNNNLPYDSNSFFNNNKIRNSKIINFTKNEIKNKYDELTTFKYQRQAAFGYAKKWWAARNPHYKDYSASGGDCANFVSQCLIAGGLSLHKGTDGSGYGVYPDVDRPTSYSNGTIPYCDYLDLHLRNYQNTTVIYVEDTNVSIPDIIDIGDVLIFGNKTGDKYKHAMIVVWVGSNDIGLAAHTTDVWNKSFNEEMQYFTCVTFYHFNDDIVGY